MVPALLLTQEQWVQPVINAVVLPAHAQTSGVEVSERRSINFGESLGFVFSERGNCGIQISTTRTGLSNTDLVLDVGISNITGLVANVSISSSFVSGVIDQGFLPDANGGGGTLSINYGEFPLGSCGNFDVTIDLRYLESESRLVAVVTLI